MELAWNATRTASRCVGIETSTFRQWKENRARSQTCFERSVRPENGVRCESSSFLLNLEAESREA